MTAAFHGQYLNYNNMQTDVELKLFQLNLICVVRRIVHKSLVERLLLVGLSPI
jgi:hypothetical protein